MATKIRLKRLGKKKQPFYRVVVADSRVQRDGKVIEEIGKYHPTESPSYISIVSERAQYWLGVGAQPTEAVLALLKITGDWQKFKGEDYDESVVKTKTEKEDAAVTIQKAADLAEQLKAEDSAKVATEEAEKAKDDKEAEGSDESAENADTEPKDDADAGETAETNEAKPDAKDETAGEVAETTPEETKDAKTAEPAPEESKEAETSEAEATETVEESKE
jgi:small subunit ribosomal protein S16